MQQRESPRYSEERRFYGFVESMVSAIAGNRHSRFSLTLDAVDSIAFDEDPAAPPAPEHLAIIRVISTPQRMQDLFEFNVPEEGRWVALTVGTSPDRPLAWILNAANDFSGQVVRTNVISIEALPNADSDEGLSGGNITDKLRFSCENGADNSTATFIRNVNPPTNRFHVRIIDVGHASCAAIHTERDKNAPIVGYFDAGAPAFFHSKSFPTYFGEQARVPASGFVALSHWDFDHYGLALTQLKQLKALDWYAPKQHVGPNAAKFQRDLGRRLHFIRRGNIPITQGLRLHRGFGRANDRNNSGYFMKVKQDRDNVLLTADVGYNFIGTRLKNGLTGLTVPHHGGQGSENPPIGSGIAAVSFGRPNFYRHPIESNLLAHTHLGWRIETTAAGASSRSDRWITAP